MAWIESTLPYWQNITTSWFLRCPPYANGGGDGSDCVTIQV
jgi:hypothetical protein